jgi:filamentous hemagglutinin family protein
MERKLMRQREGFNAKKIWRAALFASTGLSAVISLPAVVRAQTSIPATTTPQGGSVVGGSASISQAPGSTTINQSSERAAINWQSFDVGSSAKVQFNQPDANAIALNRVVGGDLSQINGQISANGQLVLINQSGVVFGKGAQVNAENIVVSTSDIATKAFMAGNMAFTGAPRPGAKIINQGNITVKDTGLVGLVAPQVENDGMITARLGQVILAGASAFTLDLYGDRLISLDVTKAVQAVDVGGKVIPALVTNRGVILADGGKVTLTAQDADALVTQLIDAGGTIRADSVGAQSGTISLQGVGGNISIAGNLLTRGTGTGSSGGAIEALTTGTVSVVPGASINASGDAGGGVIAVGTDIARARTGAADTAAPKAASVVIAQGATLAADATGVGNAGTVALLSSQSTAFDGAISVQGGAQGGNGGLAEISSDGVISLGGTVLATAIYGQAGEILLDPQTLVVSGAATTATISGTGPTVVGDFGTATVTSVIKNTDLDALSGTIILEAASLISVAASVNSTSIQALSLVSHGAISVTASIDISGSLALDAAGSLFVGAGLTASNVLLTSGTAGTDINAGVGAVSGNVTLGSTGTVFEGSAGSIVAAELLSAGSIGGDVSLAGANTITTLEGFTLGGNLTLANAGGLTVGGSVAAANVSLSGASLTFESSVHTGVLALSSSGTISQGAGTISAATLTGNAVSLASFTEPNAIGTLGAFSLSSGLLALKDAGSLDIAGNVTVAGGTLALGGSAINQTGGSITAGTLASIGTIGGEVLLGSTTNSFAVLNNFNATGTLALADAAALSIKGSVAAPIVSLSADGITLAGGTINAPVELALGGAGGFSETSGQVFTGSLVSIGTLGDHFIAGLSGTATIAAIGDFSLTTGGGGIDFYLGNATSAQITGLISAPGGGVELLGSGATETGAGAISTGELTTSLTTLSGDLLLTGNNTIALIGNQVNATGTVAIADKVSLSVNSVITGADVTLSAPTIALASGVTIAATAATPTLALASDDITVAGGNAFLAGSGTIAIAPLTASTVIDLGSASSAGTLGLPGSIISALDTTASKIIIGNGPIGTQASGIDIDGSATFGSAPVVDLSTSGTIFDNSGNLAAGTLNFSAPGGFTQTSSAGVIASLVAENAGTTGGNILFIGDNTVASFGTLPLAASGTLALFDAGTLTISGVIDPAAVTLFGSLGLDIANDVTATLLKLGSGGAITQTGGSITAATLASLGAVAGDVSLTSANNSISSLGTFVTNGNLDLNDSAPLDIAGAVTAAGNITLTGSTLTESTGSLTATALTTGSGSFSNDVTLAGNNSIVALGAFTLGGNLDLNDSRALDIDGTVSTPGNITLTGISVTESTGALHVNTLTTGTLSLLNGADLTGGNSIATLGNFTTSLDGILTLKDNESLVVAGIVSLPGPNSGFTYSGAGITESSGGVIAANAFDTNGAAVTGNVLLTGANTISSIDSPGISATGTIALNDTGSFDIEGMVSGQDIYISAPTLSAGLSQAVAITAGSAGTLAIAADAVTIGADFISFAAPSGTVAFAPLTGSTIIDLGGTASSTGTLALPGTLLAAISTTADDVLIGKAAIGTQATAIDIDNAVSFGGTTIVDLSTSGLISQTAGTFSAATLEFDSHGFTQTPSAAIDAALLQGDGGTISGSVLLPGTNNLIGELTAMSLSTGTLALNDAATLTVAGTVTAPTVSLSAPTIDVSGFLHAPTLLALGGGSISETGSITTGSLISIGTLGSATLTGANNITALGGFTLSGDLALNDTVALGINGTVTTPGAVTLTGLGVTETGALDVGTLTTGAGTLGGNVLLTGSNNVLNLAAFNVTNGGTLALDDTGSLTVGGTLSAAVATLSAASAITLASDIDAPTRLALGSGGSITQTAGTIITGSLVSDGSIGGGVTLGLANSISALGNFTLGGNLKLADAANLDITGLVQATSAGSAIVLLDGGTIIAGGTLSAPTVGLSAANSIDLEGVIDAPTLFALGGGSISQTGGTITAGSLSSGGVTITGNVALAGTHNTIASLGAFFTDGDFTFKDNGSLDINGSVVAANIGLSVPTFSLNGNLDATVASGTLALAADAITLGSGQFITNNGTVELAPATAGYGIDIGGTAANDLDITGSLASAFPASNAEVIIGKALGSTASSIAIDASASFATALLDLATSGVISDNTGTLTAQTLQFDAGSVTQASTAAIDATTLQGGTIGGNVLLPGTLNNIATLGGMSLASGTLALTDHGTLVVGGSVSAPDIYLTDSAGNGIFVAGSLVAGSAGTIGITSDALGGTGTISAPNGLVRIAPLTTSDNIDFGGTGFTGLHLATGFIDLVGGKVLQIGTPGGGTINQEQNFTIGAQTLVLDGASINFTGSLGVPTLLSFASAGNMSETGGATLSVPAITGTASGTIGLIGTNAIGTLDAVSAGGNIAFNNGPSLLIAGLVSTGTGNSITLDDNAGVTEISGGILSAGTLTTGAGSIGGNAFLTNSNSIGALSGFSVAGDLRFTDAGGAGALTLGSLNAGDAYFNADGIVIAGLLNIGPTNGTLGLTSNGGISETGAGVIEAKTLTGTDSGGDVTLLQGNSITTLGSFAAAGNNFSLHNAIGLDIAGLVSADSIVLSGTSLTESTGRLVANALATGAGSFTGNVSLSGANTINTLGGFTLSAGTLTFDDTGLLTVDGPVNAPTTTLFAQTLAIAGTINASTRLALESTGNITETTGGFISTPSLTSGGTVIGGFVSLANVNSITTLGSFSVTGNLTLDDGGSLSIAGPVTADSAAFTANGIAITGALGAGHVNLASNAGITEPGGIITASTLTGTSADAVSLLDGNSITTLGGFALTSGNFSFDNASSLNIAGLVGAATIALEDAGAITEITGGTLATSLLTSGGTTIGGNVSLANLNSITTLGGFTLASGDTLTLHDTALTIAGPVVSPFATFSAASISISGSIDATTQLALESTGNITEASGAFISTPTLTSGGTSITGNVALFGTNTINTLGAFTLGGTLALDDTGLLTVAGTVIAPVSTLSVATLDVTGVFSGTTATFSAGGIDIAGSVSLATLLALASTGNVFESGTGVIDTSTLVSTGAAIGGNVSLGNTLNAISTLGGFTIGSGHTLTLDDSGLLTVAGPVIAPTATLFAQTIAIAGTISASTGLALESTGNVFETSGFIATPSLTSGGTVIGGFVSLANANSISTLGSFSVTGNLTLDDGGSLTIAGPANAANAFLTADGIAITGALGADHLNLASTAGITEPGGIITAGTLTGTSADTVSLLDGNSITTLGGFSVTTGNFSLDNAISLDIAGLVTAPGTITLEDAGAISEIAGGTLAAAFLNSGGTTIGGDVLLANLNSITTLGGFTLASGDTLTLHDTTLTVAGPLVSPFATLSAAGISITGTIDATSQLALESTANITEASGGFISTPSLTSGGTTIIGDVSLLQPNSITTLGGFTLASGDTLALRDAGTLAIAGPVVSPFTTLAAGSIAIAGAISAASQLALETTGSISETGASAIRAGTLTSGGTVIDGNVTLGSTLNTIATLGSLTLGAGTTLVLDDHGLLTVAGPVSTPFATITAGTLAVSGAYSGTTATLSAGSIGITGSISLSTLLALESTGAVTESGAGVITTGTLTSGGTTITGNVLLANTLNAIGTLGGFTIGSGDTLVLDDAGLLTVVGPLAADHSTLVAGTIAIAGSITGITQTLHAGSIIIEAPVSVSSLLALESPGSVRETLAGVITAPTLTTGGTTIGGNVTLGNTANTIGTLGGFTMTTGTLYLADEGSPSLTIGGPVIIPVATLAANEIIGTGDFSGTTATFSAGSIDIGGIVSLTSRLALESTGNITESTGTISVPTLTSGGTAITGNVSLNGNANRIGTISPFTLGGNLVLNDATSLVAGLVRATGGTSVIDLNTPDLLTIAGPVTAPDSTLSAGSISITGALDISQTLALEANAGGVDESTGQITAGTLTSNGTAIQGTVALVNGNIIGTLSSFAATGFIILNNSPSLTIDGLVSTPAGLTLDQSGPITEVAGGTLAVGTLSSGTAITGNVALGNANTIVTLGTFTVAAGDTLALNNTGLLTVTGPVSAPFATIASGSIEVSGLLSGNTATLSAGSIDVAGSISLASLLALESTGNVTETGGFVTVPTLTSGGPAIAGAVTLADANAIGTLGAFTANGNLALTDAGLLTVAGPVSAANAVLTAGGIAFPGQITTGTLALFSTNDVTESGGGINAALLTGTVSSGSATLQSVNNIATLGEFTVAAGTLALSDIGLLTVTGPVSAPTATLAASTISVSGSMNDAAATLSAGAIAISGAINATSNLALESTGNVTEAANAVITTPLLTSGGTAIGTDAALTGTANSIGTLGGFTANNSLTLDDTGALNVAGPVAAPVVTIFSSAIAITGDINAATALALESTGQIIEPGGIITTPLLTSGGTVVGGNVSLTDANAIGTLGAFSDAGILSLTDTGLLTVNGPVIAPVVTLSSPSIAVAGFIGARTLLALESTGNISEATSALITTGTLTSGGTTIGGNVTLNSAFNSITTLGSFAAGGLALTDSTPIAITSPVAVTGTLALLDTGNITQTGGTISAATLTSDGGTIGGVASFTDAGNNIPTLGAFAAVAGLALTDAVPLNLNGNIFTGSSAALTLLDSGQPITQSGGSASAGTLNATGSTITLGKSNAIGTGGTINATSLYVNGVASISGPVAVSSGATILSPGALPVTGNITAGNLLLEALGGISQTAGAITSGAATLIAGGGINLSGVTSIANELDLIAGGDIIHPAGLLNAGTLAGAVGGTVITALGNVVGNGTLADFNFSSLTTDFGTIGNFIMQDSTFALNNDGSLAIVGSLVANTITISTNGGLTLIGTSDGTGGGIYIDGGTISAVPYFSPRPGDSVISVSNGGIVQTGVFDINSANGPPSNLFLYVTGGPVTFAPSPGQLVAPYINVEISAADGIISGNVNFDRVVILNALTKSVQLTGILDGLAGQAAASKGFVDPFPEPDFRFNACPIGSVNCTILPIETLPPGNPLQNFDLTQRKRKKLNKGIHLPGVATRDF